MGHGPEPQNSCDFKKKHVVKFEKQEKNVYAGDHGPLLRAPSVGTELKLFRQFEFCTTVSTSPKTVFVILHLCD